MMKPVNLPDSKNFLHCVDGKNTHLLVIRNSRGMFVALTDFGARIVSILVPDKNGISRDVALGFPHIKDYIAADEPYHGATVGRYANRIANGKFILNDRIFELTKNNGYNSLHGGVDGFHNKVWDRQVGLTNRVDFYYVSQDGEEGFPGKLNVTVSYELSNDNELIIKYRATSNEDTIINLTNHTYFNLNGEGNGTILDHILHMPSTKYIPVNINQIPLGMEETVENTPFDFRSEQPLKKGLLSEHEQIKNAGGYDHSFVNDQPINKCAASVYTDESGVQLDVYTTQPGIQLYTGNSLSGKDAGKSREKYGRHSGFCLETQHHPDSPNQAGFPTVTLKKGEEFTSETRYQFSIKK